MAHWIKVLLFLLVVSLTACGSDGLDDLREFTKNAHADKKPTVDPIPIMKRYETFAYSAASLTDPFAILNLRPKPAPCPTCKNPRDNRRKEPLEQYPLDALKMVGTLTRKSRYWVIIQAPDGSVHRAAVGNYMGDNNGVITKISDEKVFLVELVQTSLGSWVERDASVSIVE
jgi:type IV pilus assembly protein PilP